jgi:hypothetical protein
VGAPDEDELTLAWRVAGAIDQSASADDGERRRRLGRGLRTGQGGGEQRKTKKERGLAHIIEPGQTFFHATPHGEARQSPRSKMELVARR